VALKENPDQNMNIGVVVDNELNDDKRVLREIEILKEAGYQIYVLCFSFDNKSYGTFENINVTRIRISKRLKDLLFFFLNSFPAYEWMWGRKIGKFIALNKINILHVHDLYMAKSGWSGIKRSGSSISMILDLHENYSFAVTTYNWTKGFLRNLIAQPKKWKKKEEVLLGYAQKIIVLSAEFRDHLLNEYKFLNPMQFCVLPNVPDLDQMENYGTQSKNVVFSKKALVILYFGVVAERRGIFNALNSFREVIKMGYYADFLIIGPVDKKDRKKFHDSISSPDIQGRITYIPWIDLSELPAYLSISDICVAPFLKNPQHESGVANKIFDYMAGGRPVIVSDCLPQQKLIEKYECGLVYRNQTELTASIIKLLSDERLRIAMGDKGLRAILNEFNIKKRKSDLLEAYKLVLIN